MEPGLLSGAEQHEQDRGEVPSEHEETLFVRGSITGTGCPRTLWRLCPWRDTKAVWTQSWPSGSS